MQQSVSEGYFRPRFQFLPGPDQRLPDIIRSSLQKKDLDMCACIFFYPEQSCGNDFCIVKHQAVTGTQILRQIRKMTVSQFPAVLTDHKKPGSTPVGKRILRDQFLRKIKEIIFSVKTGFVTV